MNKPRDFEGCDDLFRLDALASGTPAATKSAFDAACRGSAPDADMCSRNHCVSSPHAASRSMVGASFPVLFLMSASSRSVAILQSLERDAHTLMAEMRQASL